MANLYRPSAHLYDVDPSEITRDDIAFYRARARQIGGDVLELGCGTGRVTLPLARDGHEIWGLDLSEEMLGELREKAAQLPGPVRARLHPVHADMADFDLGCKFDLVIAPYRAFQALIGKGKQKECLRRVRHHLSARGRFIMHVFKPRKILDQTWVQPEAFDWEAVDSRTGKTVRRYDRRKQIDLENQILYVDLVYRVEGSSVDVVEPLALSYFYEDQMRALLQDQGFTIVEEYGYFDGRPIASGPELIFVCGR
jgi:SAM-dependent methyltransferase